jgi:hypothetical protein
MCIRRHQQLRLCNPHTSHAGRSVRASISLQIIRSSIRLPGHGSGLEGVKPIVQRVGVSAPLAGSGSATLAWRAPLQRRVIRG